MYSSAQEVEPPSPPRRCPNAARSGRRGSGHHPRCRTVAARRGLPGSGAGGRDGPSLTIPSAGAQPGDESYDDSTRSAFPFRMKPVRPARPLAAKWGSGPRDFLCCSRAIAAVIIPPPVGRSPRRPSPATFHARPCPPRKFDGSGSSPSRTHSREPLRVIRRRGDCFRGVDGGQRHRVRLGDFPRPAPAAPGSRGVSRPSLEGLHQPPEAVRSPPGGPVCRVISFLVEYTVPPVAVSW